MSRVDSTRATSLVGVVLPVHDEEELLPVALEGIEQAVDALPSAISCRVAVVLDGCRDGSAAVADAWAGRVGALVIMGDYRSVGTARRAGSQALLSLWPDADRATIWLATTDADSRVPPDWLAVQLEAYRSGSDLWAGRVRVVEESAVARQWKEAYAAERCPIHGASLGFSGSLYEHIGGFRRMRSGEDRDLHRRAVAAGFGVTYDFRAVVTTSARRRGRAPGGFASVLDGVEGEQLEAIA
jgi:cellulose synthase/poly-beta-1,6-N-acetylglucosamine synthase-like glycosyltransferase